jgi:O-methyltransferase
MARERKIAASGPAPSLAEMRDAYLSMLKLCLCDLTGAGTTSVEGLPHGRLVSRELAGEGLGARTDGRDWPLHALTMTGLRRLDALQECIEQIVSDRIAGDVIEAGAWRGGSSILMRATLDSLGDERTVWVADSFEGFKPGTPTAYEGSVAPYLAAFDFLAVPMEEVAAGFHRFGLDDGVMLVPGYFEDTLPRLAGHAWSLLRLDGDTYDATLQTLESLYPWLAPGGWVVIDDYGDIAECRAAVERFREQQGITEPIEAIDWTGARWRRDTNAPATSPSPRARPQDVGAVSVAELPVGGAVAAAQAPRQVPGPRELTLEAELSALADRVAAMETELARAADTERHLQELTSSTSWRVTRPLREIALRLRARRELGR